MVAVGQLLGVVRLLTDSSNLALLGTDQLNAQAMVGITAFNDIWYVGQLLFGLHLLVIGYLAYRSGYLPRCSVSCSPSPAWATPPTALARCSPRARGVDISTFTFIGEFLLALWLLIRARQIAISASALGWDPPPDDG